MYGVNIRESEDLLYIHMYCTLPYMYILPCKVILSAAKSIHRTLPRKQLAVKKCII